MDYTVEQIMPDEAGAAFTLSSYKPFRLNALQTDPEYFGSNYAREAAFDDTFWRKRVLRPDSTTFVATRSADRTILSSLTLIRGSAASPVLAMAVGLLPEEREANAPTLVHWVVNAVYTAREARRRGVAKAVFTRALEYAFETAEKEGKSCLVTLLAKHENAVAIGMYEKMGLEKIEYVDDSENVLLYTWKRR